MCNTARRNLIEPEPEPEPEPNLEEQCTESRASLTVHGSINTASVLHDRADATATQQTANQTQHPNMQREQADRRPDADSNWTNRTAKFTSH